MPEWLGTIVAVAAGVAAIFFFAKYRETATALHECERMKRRLSTDLNRYRDVPALRALRDGLVGSNPLPRDDEGREHLLLRNGDMQLHHVILRRQSVLAAEGEQITYLRDGADVVLEEFM